MDLHKILLIEYPYYEQVIFCSSMAFQTMQTTTSRIVLVWKFQMFLLIYRMRPIHCYNGSKIIKWRPTLTTILMNITKEWFQIKIGNKTVSNKKYKKLLGVKVDHEINFNKKVLSLYKKASWKASTFARRASCMTFD